MVSAPTPAAGPSTQEPASQEPASQEPASQEPASTVRRPLTERRMARTRRELADAAARLFIERGYDATTVEDIVAEVEISARTFFRYFGSKEEVVASLWRWGVEEVVTALRAVPPDRPLLEALCVAVADSCRHAAESPARTRAFLRMVRDTPALRARRLQVSYGEQQDLAACLAERLGRDPADLHVTLMSGAVVMAINTGWERWASQPTIADDPGPGAQVERALRELTKPLLPM